jgi:Zn-dependent oligopeptidase
MNLQNKDNIEQIQKRIAEIERQANTNISADNSKVDLTASELIGLSSDFISKLEPSESGYYVSMKTPEIMPALRLCKNEETRKKLNFAYSSRC